MRRLAKVSKKMIEDYARQMNFNLTRNCPISQKALVPARGSCMDRHRPADTGYIAKLIPVSAILLGVLVLGETLETWMFGGMVLIFAGFL